MSSNLEYRGLSFTVDTERDDDHGPPWKEHDGHGRVTDWEPLDAGLDPTRYRLLSEDRHAARYYDWQESLKIALRDRWGLGDEARAAFVATLGGIEPSKAAIAAEAVRLDYEYLRGWCRDEWRYVGVIVTLTGTRIQRSLWGVEDQDDQYIAEVARELADEIISEGAEELQGQIDARQEMLARLTAVRTAVGGGA